MHELNLRPIAEGIVKCGGENVVGTNESIGLITFKENNNVKSFDIERSKEMFHVGDDVSVTCVVVAEPSFDITPEWYYVFTGERVGSGILSSKKQTKQASFMSSDNKLK